VGLVALGVGCFVIVVVVGQLHEPRTSRAQYDLVEYFRAKVTDEGTRTVRFEWGFRAPYRNDEHTCTLDPDADRLGVVEESIPSCETQRSISWSYEEPGSYEAALVVTRRLGGSDRATVTVKVGPETAAVAPRLDLSGPLRSARWSPSRPRGLAGSP
jgi:hypothetical protein